MVMLSKRHILLVILTIAAVAIVFVAPSVNLEPTILPSSVILYLIFIAVAALYVGTLGVEDHSTPSYAHFCAHAIPFERKCVPNLTDLYCNRLC